MKPCTPPSCLTIFRSKNDCLVSVSALDGLDCIDVGKSGNVYAIDMRRVLKRYESGNEEEVFTEREAYKRLGHHPNIAKCFGSLEDGSLVLERGQVVRGLLSEQTSTNPIPLHTKCRWIKHAASGLQHLHKHGIIQSNVGCRNMIITKGSLKLIDFEGCSIDGEGPLSSYEWFSYKPSKPRASVKTDIFALGCAMYEIMSGNPPYHEFKRIENPREYVEDLYKKNQFPDVSDLPMGDVMLDCWYGKFDSMSEVIERIERVKSQSMWQRIVATQHWLGCHKS